MACNDRQLSQAQREAAYQQQRTGVVRAVRPFTGTPSIENLIDYINRELFPALRQARAALNDVYLQVADQAPSANPLAYYFSESTAAADPTDGRIRLNAATQNTATIIRVSENNARLQTVQPWLDVMSGGVTTPLGVVTLVDAVNPGRFLRFDLNSMTDQGAYWDLGVTIVESSDANPFVEDEPVVLGFIASVAAAGATIPVGSISPIANDTFLGNVSGGVAAPAAVGLSTLAGAGLAFAAHTLDVTGSTSITVTSDQVQRAALTGFAEASLNSNATTSAEPLVTYTASANMSAERVLTTSTTNTVSTSVAGQIELQRAALTGAIVASANSNATVFAGILDNGGSENNRTNLNFVDSTTIGLSIADDAGNDELEISASRAALTGAISAGAGSNATVFAGILDNGVATSNRTNLNFLSSTSCTASINDDFGNDELEITVQRAALTGDVTASANSNATTIANDAVTNAKLANMATPRLKGRTTAATGDPEDLTLSNSTSITWDSSSGGSISMQRAALTGDVTASANSNTTAIAAGVIVNADVNASAGINLSKLATGDSVTWTGDHGFQGQASFQFQLVLGSAQANSSTGQVDDLDVSGDTVVRFTGPPSLLTGMVSGATGQLVLLVNASTSADITISDEHASSSSSNRFDLANAATSLVLRRQGAVFAFYDGSSSRWRIVRAGSDATA